MRNIIDAIDTIVRSGNLTVGDESQSHNRINSVGEALEEFIKDAFANAFNLDPISKKQARSSIFSYLGNQNNPPDAMLRGGEAIEIKKIETATTEIALNSSYPKDKLYRNSPGISKSCSECEEWQVKDMIYIVGHVGKNDKKLHSLCIVYGVDYCADKSIYEAIRDKIKDGINKIEDIDFAETNELGRVNNVDPLGITYLRCRSLWHIKNPLALFKDYYSFDTNPDFKLVAVINNDIIARLGNIATLEKLSKDFKTFKIKDAQIEDPNNPAVLKQAKIITYYESY